MQQARRISQTKEISGRLSELVLMNQRETRNQVRRKPIVTDTMNGGIYGQEQADNTMKSKKPSLSI